MAPASMFDRGTKIRLAAEFLAWLCLLLPFSALYLFEFHKPVQAVIAHCCVVLALWIGSIGLRYMMNSFLGSNHKPRPLASSLIMTTPWFVLLLWYAVALIGLFFWGRVTSLPMILVYADQFQFLLQSLEIPTWLPLLIPAVFIAIVLVLSRTSFMRPDWVYRVSQAAGKGPHRRSARLLAILGVILPTALLTANAKLASLHPQEPIGMSLLPKSEELAQTNAYAASPATDAAEEKARATYKAATKHAQRNIILIVSDAMRADQMGVYGYARNTTPFLSSLQASGNIEAVKRVRSACSESLCGYTALASSRPIHLQPTKPFTLYEALKINGYKVHLVLSGDHTSFYGLRSLYSSADSYYDGSKQPRMKSDKDNWMASMMRYINDDRLVIDRLAKFPHAQANQPAMIQIVLMSTHGLGTRLPEYVQFKPSISYYSLGGKKYVSSGKPRPLPLVNFYDNGMLQADHYIQEIVEILKAKGYLDNALLVVTGDHGELLGEHGQYSHSVTVNEPVMNIPLLFARYGYKGNRMGDWPVASQIDIAPTIMREMDLPTPDTWIGVALQDTPSRRFVYFQQGSEAGFYPPSAPGQLFKYWFNFSNRQSYLFEVLGDPGEHENLSGSLPPKQLMDMRMRVAHGGLQSGGVN